MTFTDYLQLCAYLTSPYLLAGLAATPIIWIETHTNQN